MNQSKKQENNGANNNLMGCNLSPEYPFFCAQANFQKDGIWDENAWATSGPNDSLIKSRGGVGKERMVQPSKICQLAQRSPNSNIHNYEGVHSVNHKVWIVHVYGPGWFWAQQHLIWNARKLSLFSSLAQHTDGHRRRRYQLHPHQHHQTKPNT